MIAKIHSAGVDGDPTGPKSKTQSVRAKPSSYQATTGLFPGDEGVVVLVKSLSQNSKPVESTLTLKLHPTEIDQIILAALRAGLLTLPGYEDMLEARACLDRALSRSEGEPAMFAARADR